MVALIVSAALAACSAQYPRTRVFDEGLGPETPLVIASSWGTPEGLAQRIRVRGPDGNLHAVEAEKLGLDVRLSPLEPWAPGTWIVEERGDFDSDGHRIYGPGQRSAWFVLTTLEVAAPSPVPLPNAVVWTRTRYGVRGTTPPIEGVKRVSLEIEGAGIVRTMGGLTVHTSAHVRCNDTRSRMPVPVGNDIRVRMIAHGTHGGRAAGPWTTLGPEGAPPTGVSGDPQALETWSSIPASMDTRPTEMRSGSCPTLERTERHDFDDIHPRTKLHVDASGQLHTSLQSPEGEMFDGQDMDQVPPITGVVGQGETLLIKTYVDGEAGFWNPRSGTHHAVGTHVVKWEIEGLELKVIRRDPITHERWSQMYSLLGAPLGPPTSVRHPIEVRRQRPGFEVNGESVDARLHDWRVGPEFVAIIQSRSGVQEVALYDDQGRRMWAHPLPEDTWVKGVRVDHEGVFFRVQSNGGSYIMGLDRMGQWRDPAGVEVPFSRQRTHTERYPWRGGHLVVRNRHAYFVDQEGRSTPSIFGFYGRVHLDGEEIVRTSIHTKGRGDTRYRCSDRALGVPQTWP